MGCCVGKKTKYQTQEQTDQQFKQALQQKTVNQDDIGLDVIKEHSKGSQSKTPGSQEETPMDDSEKENPDNDPDEEPGSQHHDDGEQKSHDHKEKKKKKGADSDNSESPKDKKHSKKKQKTEPKEVDENEKKGKRKLQDSMERVKKKKKQNRKEESDEEQEDKKKKKHSKKKKGDEDDEDNGGKKKKKKHTHHKRKKGSGSETEGSEKCITFKVYHEHHPKKGSQLFRSSDYRCDIRKIDIKREDMGDYTNYTITFTLKFQHEEFLVACNGILKEQIPQSGFRLRPVDFLKGTEYSIVESFFQSTKYFEARQDQPDDSIISTFQMKAKRHFEISLVSLQGSQLGGVSPTKKNKDVSSMVEFMIIYDIFYQQNFKNLLVTYIMQKNFPLLKEEVLQINDLRFIFDKDPTFDMPQISHLAIFYEDLDYSLNHLYNFCYREFYALQEESLAEITRSLLSILIKCYRMHFYGLNINLDSVFYQPHERSFKITPFNRFKPLVSLIPNASKENVDKKVQAKFAKGFRKDQASIVDIIVAFSTLRTNKMEFDQVKAMSTEDKLERIQSFRYNPEHESIKNFLATTFTNVEIQTYEDVINRINALKEFQKDLEHEQKKSHEKFILTMEMRAEREKEQQRRDQVNLEQDVDDSNASQIDESFPEDSHMQNDEGQEESKNQSEPPSGVNDEAQFEILPGLHIDFDQVFCKEGKPYGLCPEIMPDHERAYRRIYIASLLEFGNKQKISDMINAIKPVYIKYLTESPRKEVIASQYVIILDILEKCDINLSEDEKQKIVEDMYNRIFKQYSTSQNPIYYLALIRVCEQLMQYEMYNKLDKILEKYREANVFQNKMKISMRHPKKNADGKKQHSLRGNDRENGVIQARKAVVVCAQQAMMNVSTSNFSQASHHIQMALNYQKLCNLEKTVLFAYCLFLNGIISQGSLSINTAMLNYDISKNIYFKFFHKNHQAIADIDCQLGELYMSQKEFDNSMKSYTNAYLIRSDFYPAEGDDVLQVLVELLRIYVEQDETGLALNICAKYMKLANENASLGKKKKIIKSKIYGIMQLAMGCIYQQVGSYISAILCYQRSCKVFQAAKHAGSIWHYYVIYKRKECLGLIYNRALVVNGFIGRNRDWIFRQQGFTTLREGAKECFTLASEPPPQGSESKSSDLRTELALANFHLHKHEIEKAQAEYEECLLMARQLKKDQKYGVILLKLGEISIRTQNYVKAIEHFHHSIEFFQQYMIFPLKHLSTIKAQFLLCIAYLLRDDVKTYQDTFAMAAATRQQFEKVLKYDLSKQQKSRKTTANLPNKFDMLLRIYGAKLGYQLINAFETIQKISDLRKYVTEATRIGKDVKQVALECFEKIFQNDATQEEVNLKRITITTGNHMKLTLKPSTPRMTANLLDFDEEEDPKNISKPILEIQEASPKGGQPTPRQARGTKIMIPTTKKPLESSKVVQQIGEKSQKTISEPPNANVDATNTNAEKSKIQVTQKQGQPEPPKKEKFSPFQKIQRSQKK